MKELWPTTHLIELGHRPAVTVLVTFFPLDLSGLQKGALIIYSEGSVSFLWEVLHLAGVSCCGLVERGVKRPSEHGKLLRASGRGRDTTALNQV